MHHSRPLPLTFEGPEEQGFGDKNCQNGSQGKPCLMNLNRALDKRGYLMVIRDNFC